MKKLAYSFLFAFCVGYMTNDFIHKSDSSLIATPVHASVIDPENAGDTGDIKEIDIEEIDIEALYKALDFTEAVRAIVEACIVEDGKIHC